MSIGRAAPQPDPIPLEGLRGFVARRMMLSAGSTARVSLHGDADVGSLSEARKQLKMAGHGASYEDLVIHCISRALPRHPLLNGNLIEQVIVPSQSVNIGVAVALEDGLVVPTLPDVQDKSIGEIAQERADLVARARNNQLGVREMTGATFTLSNIGAHRVRHFTPLINVPQIAILGLGRIAAQPWVDSAGCLTVRPVLGLSLSFNHGAVNGDPAAAFLGDLIAELEGFRLDDEHDPGA